MLRKTTIFTSFEYLTEKIYFKYMSSDLFVKLQESHTFSLKVREYLEDKVRLDRLVLNSYDSKHYAKELRDIILNI